MTETVKKKVTKKKVTKATKKKESLLLECTVRDANKRINKMLEEGWDIEMIAPIHKAAIIIIRSK